MYLLQNLAEDIMTCAFPVYNVSADGLGKKTNFEAYDAARRHEFWSTLV